MPKRKRTDFSEIAANAEKVRICKADYERRLSQARRNLPPLPPCENPELVEKCRYNLELFCRTFLKRWCPAKFSKAHKEILAGIQRAVLKGGKQAYAAPRGYGKSVMGRAGLVWACLYGHSRFSLLIAAKDDLAAESLWQILVLFSTTYPEDGHGTDLLHRCFPILYCWVALDLQMRKAQGQLYNNVSTRIKYNTDCLQMPQIPGYDGSGCIIRTASIGSKFRGLSFTADDGSILRPQLVLLDDLQSDQSAASAAQVEKQFIQIDRAVAGLKAAGKKMGQVFIGTVIAKNDLCSVFCNREAHPEWNGLLYAALPSLPKNIELWTQDYYIAWKTSLEKHDDFKTAKRFYREHRKELEEGADVLWKEVYNRDDACTALEELMRIYLESAPRFFSEYQNSPTTDTYDGGNNRIDLILPDALNRLPCGVVPAWCNALTCGVDIGKYAATYCVVGYDRRTTTSAIVDYGTWPEQPWHDYSYSNLAKTWNIKGADANTLIYNGLKSLLAKLVAPYTTEDGRRVQIQQIFIDRGYCEAGVQAAIRAAGRPYILAIKGYQAAARFRQLDEWRDTLTQVHVGNGGLVLDTGDPKMPYVLADVNLYKSAIAERMSLSPAVPKHVEIYGTDPARHKMFRRHLNTEYAVEETSRGRTVSYWTLGRDRDNHLLDALTYAFCAASFAGLAILHEPKEEAPVITPGPRIAIL